MNLLLDLLEPINCPAIQSSALLTLVTSLLSRPQNTRCFEAVDGLLAVTSLFKSRGTSREVKMKVVEFLYFYLMPEVPVMRPGNGERLSSDLQRSPSKRLGSSEGASGITKSTEEKQALLGRHLSNVEDLVEDLRESAPFGANIT